ncbi:uncharacterized protein J3D65DRAFT_677684 [Phyllosticta citribraziliensis]|uniref:Uncharacterized protein n=1 Tax=Phyllosticta citribraziliensis TaxID=989973 RepID=A0ABR1LL45_9PEZI
MPNAKASGQNDRQAKRRQTPHGLISSRLNAFISISISIFVINNIVVIILEKTQTHLPTFPRHHRSSSSSSREAHANRAGQQTGSHSSQMRTDRVKVAA